MLERFGKEKTALVFKIQNSRFVGEKKAPFGGTRAREVSEAKSKGAAEAKGARARESNFTSGAAAKYVIARRSFTPGAASAAHRALRKSLLVFFRF